MLVKNFNNERKMGNLMMPSKSTLELKAHEIEDIVKEKGEKIKNTILDVQYQQADLMRQTQASMNIAMAREQFLWGSALYSLLVVGITGEAIKHKSVPRIAIPPLLMGGFVLTWLGDIAYGNKMVRVRHEAEFIQQFERNRLVPPSSMPVRKFWTEEAKLTENIGRISDKPPFSWRTVGNKKE
jgi:hypothetical protein